MPQVILTPEAGNDITRFADFLIEHGAHEQAQQVFLIIAEALRILERTPDVGRIYPLDKLPNTRELVIKYGKSGYMALYTHEEHRNLVIIHAIRHQRELGYKI